MYSFCTLIVVMFWVEVLHSVCLSPDIIRVSKSKSTRCAVFRVVALSSQGAIIRAMTHRPDDGGCKDL